MKDEIKEILDKFDKVLENYELDKKWGQMSVDSICHLFPNEMIIIRDYITNLQEENDILKRDIEAMKHNYNLLVRCIENGESITQKFENGLTQKDYKSRIDKAIHRIQLLQMDGEVSIKDLGLIARDLTGGDEEWIN